MRLPPEAINELKSIYQTEFGIDLTSEEAQIQAKNKLRLVAMALGAENLI